LGVLVTVLLFTGVAACGDDDDEGTTATTGQDSGSSTTGDTGGELDTENPFRIASPNDQTGAQAAVGTFWRIGLEIATEEINANGGILGREVVVDYVDTTSTNTTASQVMADMIASGDYHAIVSTSAGPLTSPAIVEQIKRAGAFGIFPGIGTGTNNPEEFPTLFDNVYPPQESIDAVACIGMTYEPERVAFLAIEGDYPNQIVDGVRDRMEEEGVEVVGEERYAFDATNITAQVQKLLEADPDVIYLFAFFGAVTTALQAFQDLGATDSVQLVGDNEVMTAPPSVFLPEGLQVPDNFFGEQWEFNVYQDGELSDRQQELADKVAEKTDGEFFVVLGTYLYVYDALMQIKWAAEDAGSDDPEAMIEALESLGDRPEVDTGGAVIPNPGYTPEFHGATGGNFFAADFNGEIKSGLFPAEFEANC
jgi:branched-chain amino acid transport system substrate-binding protein